MSKANNKTTIADYLSISHPVIAIETAEETRLLADLLKLKTGNKEEVGFDFSKYTIYSISASKKLLRLLPNTEGALYLSPATLNAGGMSADVVQGGSDYSAAFLFAATPSEAEERILVVFDFQHIVKNGGAYRTLKDQLPMLRKNGATVILVAPSWDFPDELKHEVAFVDYALPTRQELNTALSIAIKDAKMKEPEDDLRTASLDALSGLTMGEAETATMLSFSKSRGLDPGIMSLEKMKLIKSSGLLDIAPPPIVEPGGLGEVKLYVTEEVMPVKDDPQLQCRGILATGVQGTGKSLLAKWIGKKMQLPVISMRFGSLKDKMVGGSEANMRRALKLIDAVAPCVVWVDEVEKSVSGHQSSGQTDAGTTSTRLAIWLEWLQEHETQVLTVATCNRYDLLPDELTRPGRFDERFFMGFPGVASRAEIAEAHIERLAAMKPKELGPIVETIVELTDMWTGAEIEQLIKSAARQTRRALTTDAIRYASKKLRPISKVKPDEVQKLLEWAKATLRPAELQQHNSDGASRKLR